MLPCPSVAQDIEKAVEHGRTEALKAELRRALGHLVGDGDLEDLTWPIGFSEGLFEHSSR